MGLFEVAVRLSVLVGRVFGAGLSCLSEVRLRLHQRNVDLECRTGHEPKAQPEDERPFHTQ